MNGFSHADDQGKARMVDVGGKIPQRRLARAEGSITIGPRTCQLLRNNQLQKGDVLAVAQIAGILAAKRTPELIPLCHPLTLDHVAVRLTVTDESVIAASEVACVGRTGVEMEALTAVSVALLAVYDMCKAVDDAMRIGPIYLVEKSKTDVT